MACGCIGCNAEARAAERARKEAEFEAYLVAKEAAKAPVKVNAAAPDLSYDDVIARMTTLDEAELVGILTGRVVEAER